MASPKESSFPGIKLKTLRRPRVVSEERSRIDGFFEENTDSQNEDSESLVIETEEFNSLTFNVDEEIDNTLDFNYVREIVRDPMSVCKIVVPSQIKLDLIERLLAIVINVTRYHQMMGEEQEGEGSLVVTNDGIVCLVTLRNHELNIQIHKSESPTAFQSARVMGLSLQKGIRVYLLSDEAHANRRPKSEANSGGMDEIRSMFAEIMTNIQQIDKRLTALENK